MHIVSWLPPFGDSELGNGFKAQAELMVNGWILFVHHCFLVCHLELRSINQINHSADWLSLVQWGVWGSHVSMQSTIWHRGVRVRVNKSEYNIIWRRDEDESLLSQYQPQVYAAIYGLQVAFCQFEDWASLMHHMQSMKLLSSWRNGSTMSLNMDRLK